MSTAREYESLYLPEPSRRSLRTDILRSILPRFGGASGSEHAGFERAEEQEKGKILAMPKEIMRRQASDNTYLHKDFHGALSTGIEYIHQTYGADAVKEYLRRFTKAYYAPLISEVKERGLVALKEHFEKIYAAEGGEVDIDFSDDQLTLNVKACPAVTHMRTNGYTVARMFSETSRTVNEALCEGTPYASELLNYDEATGSCIQRFYRRDS